MSILDGPFTDGNVLQGGMEYAMRVIALTAPQLDDDTRRIFELTRDGSTIGDALGVTKEQKTAMLDLGCRLIQAGQMDKAADILLRLTQLDPLEERAHYALGVICQTRGELHKAAQLYLLFLALDATNPMGYLRLGECLLAAKEYREAHSAFNAARKFAEEGKGQPGNLEEALKMLDVPDIRLAGAAPKQ